MLLAQVMAQDTGSICLQGNDSGVLMRWNMEIWHTEKRTGDSGSCKSPAGSTATLQRTSGIRYHITHLHLNGYLVVGIR